MEINFPLYYSLKDGTKVEVTTGTEQGSFIFILDQPTGNTESFIWSADKTANTASSASLPVSNSPVVETNPQIAEAIELFQYLQQS